MDVIKLCSVLSYKHVFMAFIKAPFYILLVLVGMSSVLVVAGCQFLPSNWLKRL